jgi:serine/threonine protein kinase
MAVFEGMRLGAYELLECIGEGGMAEVYRAKQLTAFGREVALKVIRPEFTGDSPFRRRFLREALAISRLSHPHILPLIEFGDEDGMLYLVMPLVREGTLRDLLHERDGWLTPEEALPLFYQLCEAVQYAHEEDIIHRDIKPQNILLQQHTHVLLADFGIARDRFDTHMTQTGAGLGTAEYMAPEQAEGRSDARSDIYSLGVVLYQMLTGTVPYSGTTPLQVLMKQASEPIPDPRSYNPNLPAELMDIFQIVLAKAPNQRFASAQALSHALQQVMGDVSLPPFPGQPPGFASPNAPTRLDTGVLPTLGPSAPRRPLEEPEAPHSFGSLPTALPGVTPPALGAARHTSPPGAETIITPSAWEVRAHRESDWATTWNRGDEIRPPDADSKRSSKPRRGLLIGALIGALLLTLAITSIASGYVDLPWLLPGSTTHSDQPVAAPPGIIGQSTNTPEPIMTAVPQPGNTPAPQPTAMPMPSPQATDTPAPQPTDTPTPQPTSTSTAAPAPQPTATPAPQPTDTPTPQPTDTPTPGPAATATPGSTNSPAPTPGNSPTPEETATPAP